MIRLGGMSRRRLAYLASMDAGNRSMRRAGRTAWSWEDAAVAADEYSRLYPLEAEEADARAALEAASRRRESRLNNS